MSVDRPVRIMWLLNHTSARKFELPMLQSIGFNEIFTPKKFPQEHHFRSASVDCSYDESLTIPRDILHRLNEVDWYAPVAVDTWKIVNQFFDIIFMTPYKMECAENIVANFKGSIVLRAYGLPEPLNYTDLLSEKESLAQALGRSRSAVWFAEAYRNLRKIEDDYFFKRAVYLPLGLRTLDTSPHWEGNDERVLFICPEAASNPYYSGIYRDFIRNFGKLPYAIGDAQPVAVPSPNVLGFVSREDHERNMRQFRVMFYHSTEPRHIHYHPFEAVSQGMPLVFMGNGMLDRLGGSGLPGRASSIGSAKSKLTRILKGDKKFIAEIRRSQKVLLEAMRPDNLRDAWRVGMSKIVAALPERAPADVAVARRRRVAVIVPIEYRGGSLRGAKLLAEAIWKGSRQAGEDAEVVIGHLDRPESYGDDQWTDLHPGIIRRPYTWRCLDRRQSKDAMTLAGFEFWNPTSEIYGVLSDGMKNFSDCDAWIFVSDRLSQPPLPLRPQIYMVYDYLQRYLSFEGVGRGGDRTFLENVHRGHHVLVTTNFTRQDAIHYAGLPASKVTKVPMLAPIFKRDASSAVAREQNPAGYFVWATNGSAHKNQLRALQALEIYYGEMGGRLRCFITDVNTKHLFSDRFPELRETRDLYQGNDLLRRKLKWLGELSDPAYRRTLSQARFIWHTALIDNGTFSVVEAESLGVRALSSDYPPMREIAAQFGLNLTFFDPRDVRGMAKALKAMEEETEGTRPTVPTAGRFAGQSVDALCGPYWAAVREWL